MPSTKRPYIIVTAERGCKRCNRGAQYGVEGPDGVALGMTWADRGEAADIAARLTLAYKAGERAQIARLKAHR